MISNISNYSFIPKINFTSRYRRQKIRVLKSDSFEKTKVDDFSQWAKETNFLSDGLNKTLRDENLIGQGFSHYVFKIDNNDDYVLRVDKRFGLYKTTDYSNYRIRSGEDKNLKGNFGQEVAIITNNKSYKEEQIQVLRKQNGIQNGISQVEAMAKNQYYYIPYNIVEPRSEEEMNRYFEKCISILSSMPQKTFDNLIKDIDLIDKAGYKVDYFNPNNFLLDKENNKINIIDLEQKHPDNKNDYSKIILCLIDSDYLPTYLKTNSETKVEQNITNIIRKFVFAMQKYNKKFSIPDSDFTHNFIKSKEVQKAFNVSNEEELLKVFSRKNLISLN